MNKIFLYSIDYNVIEMFIVSAKSLRKYTDDKIIVFTNGFKRYHNSLVLNEIKNVELIEIGHDLRKIIDWKSDNIKWKLSLSAFGWFFINKLSDIDKILFIDADTMFIKNPVKVFELNSSKTFSAVREPIVEDTFKSRFQSHWKNSFNYTFIDHATSLGLNIIEYNNYVNSGVILIDLNSFKKNDYHFKLVKWHKENPERLFNDQDVLNAVGKGDIFFLDAKWNYTKATFGNLMTIGNNRKYISLSKKAIILHYAGKTGKPYLKSRSKYIPKKRLYLKEYNKAKREIISFFS